MNKRYTLFQRILSTVLAIVLVVGLAPMLSTTARGAQSDLRIFGEKYADPSTMDWEAFFGPGKMDTEFAGGVWSDKSVYTQATAELPGIELTDGKNFLVSMSAIASNLTITGHATAPTDTMLVLDLSGSMITTYEVGTVRQQSFGNNYRYTTVNGRNVELVKAMVDATNAAIAQLMEQNPNNRVGVVLFSGNTSSNEAATAASATVVLPLGRYAGVSGEYLQMDATYLRDVALYRRSGNRWVATGETVDYIPTSNAVSVSAKSGLTTEAGGEVSGSKTVTGGTYTQNGLYKALQEFNNVTDTRVPDGKVQAGADRVPAIVLMTDGAPTIATSSYNSPGDTDTGSGQNENNMITFLTQLTAAYVRGAVSKKYTEEGSAEQKVLFLTLGLGTENSTGATNTLYPAGTTGDVAAAWDTYLAQQDNATREYDLGGYERDITRDSLVTAMNYVDKYYYADDAASLISSFESIVSEIELKAESYATLVENVGANFSGYVSFEDELGELMEVVDMKGILLGDTLFSGEELAKGMTEGNLGTPSESNNKGDELIRTVKERIPGTDTTAAQQLVHNAYMDQQLYWDSADSWSNYIGWYAKSDGSYLGFWDKDSGYENAPADALYANKSYGYLGDNGNSDMMHVVVMVRTNLQTLHQTVFFKIPAALLPTVTYNVTLDENDPDTVEAFSRDGAEPMQVVFEVGLRSDINSVNLEEKIKAHMEAGGHIHRNNNGSVTLYTNAWGADNDADRDGQVDYNEALIAEVAVAHFHPALENGRYYFTEDTLVLDASGNPVTTVDRPTDTDNDPSNGTGYHHDHYIYSQTARTTVDMPISAVTLAEKAQRNAAGQWYIPAGTIYRELSRFSTPKAPNETGTLGYSDYYAVFENAGNQDVYNFLGNNGTITIAPATGIALKKAVADGLSASGPYAFEVALSNIPAGQSASPVLTDANGAPLTGVTMSAYENGKVTVTMPADVTAYITGIPAGTTVTVTELIGGDYKITGATVDGVAAAVVNNSVSLTVPAFNQNDPVKQIVPITVTNAPNGYGDLLISKDVTHALASDPAALANKVFTFQVKLEGEKIIPGTSSFATSNGGNVTVGANGTITLLLKNEESVTIYDIPEDTVYTVTETDIEDGFKLDSVNGDTALATATGSILADQIHQAAFINRYSDEYAPVNVTLSVNVTKSIDGEDADRYTANEDFSFVLEQLIDGTYQNPQTVTVKNGATGTLVADLPFEDVGIYEFRVTEQLPATRTPGMTYSTQRSMFVVNVTDVDMDGRLEIAASNEAHTTVNVTATGNDPEAVTAVTVDTTFTNTYEFGSVPLKVNLYKDLVNESGVAQSKTQFRFVMIASDADGNPLAGATANEVYSGAAGYATFEEVLHDAGTYCYLVYEVIPDGATLDPQSGKPVFKGIYYDATKYLVTVETSVDSLSNAVVIDSQTMTKLGETAAVSTAVFANRYDPADTSATVDVSKTVTGLASSSEEFFFNIVRTNDTYTGTIADNTVAVSRISITGEGENSFRFNFSQVGTYHYVITEEVPAGAQNNVRNGMHYDAARYHAQITVSVDDDGKLYVSDKQIHKLGSPAAVNTAAFTNTYTVTGEEQIVLSGSKTLSGRRLSAGEFEFVLYDEDGDPLDTVRNAANGSFSFKALTFTPADLGANNTPKTYTFSVKETANGLGGVTYDPAEYTVEVTVSHEDGVLKVSQVMEKNDEPYTGDIAFTNTYKAEDVTVTLHGNKHLTGDWSAVANKGFTFHLHEADAQFNITGAAETVSVANGDYTNGAAAFTFTKTFADQQEGFYYYVLHEDTSAAAGGIGYDAGEYHITVNISDPGNGQLTALVTMYRPGTGNIANDPALHAPVAVFSNVYSVAPTELELTGTKTLNGRDMTAGEFIFQILEDGLVVGEGTNAAAPDGTAAAITFDTITYTAPGRHTYTIVELKDTTTGGIGYHETPFTVVVDVVDNGEGTLSAAVVAGESDTIAFVNTYSVSAVDLELTGTKTLTGDWSAVSDANKRFTFHILDGTTVKSEGISAAPVNGSAQISFQKLSFSAAGTYTYKIVEVDADMGGITYSDKEYTLVVTVTDNGDGTLSAAYTVDGTPNGDIAFENIYSAKETSLVLNATKKYDKPLVGNDFTFSLKGSIGTQSVNQEKKNDANGQIAFDKLTFTQAGTYTFQVSEVIGILGFIRYDKTLYEVVVTVTDDGKGQLEASYTVNTVKDGDIIFTNSYILDGKGALVLEGTKELTGRDMADGEFRFGLYDAEGKLVAEAANAGSKFTLKLDGLGKDHIGKKLTYTVREILPVDDSGKALSVHNGVTYDQTAYTVEVTVTDNGTGGVNVAHKLLDAGSIAFKNSYAPSLAVSKAQTVGTGAAATTQTEVRAGETVTYTISVKNTGAGTLLGITATDKIPAGLVLKAGSISGGGTESGGVITWQIASLAAGETVDLTFQVTVPRVSEKTVWKNIAATAHNIPGEDPTPDTWSSNEVELVEYVVTSPQTGDDTPIWLILAAMVLSGGALTALIISSRKKKAE